MPCMIRFETFNHTDRENASNPDAPIVADRIELLDSSCVSRHCRSGRTIIDDRIDEHTILLLDSPP
jgi:hypothetical protein